MFILLATQIYFISHQKLICFPLGQGCLIQEIIDYLLLTIYIYIYINSNLYYYRYRIGRFEHVGRGYDDDIVK